MKKKLPQEPKNYRPEELTGEMKELIKVLQINFHSYICSKQYPVINSELFGDMGVRLVGLELVLKMIEKGLSEGVLVNPREVQNWFMQKGTIENACKAADKLKEEYDVGIGIAKKGLWLSYLFSEFGWRTFDFLVKRTSEDRFICPIDPFPVEELRGKRVILFENDAVTGKSIASLAEYLHERVSPQSIDLLMMYRYCRMDLRGFLHLRESLAPGQMMGGDEKTGDFIVDAMSQIPSKLIRRKMTLEGDFRGRSRGFERLKRKLGV